MINIYNDGYNAARMYIEERNKCCDKPTNPFEYRTLEYNEWEDGYFAFEETWYDI